MYNQIVDNFRTLKESTNEEKIKESLFEAELYMNHLESIRKERVRTFFSNGDLPSGVID